MSSRQRAHPRPQTHMRPRPDAEAKVALAERVLTLPDVSAAVQSALQWLGRYVGVEQSVCTVLSEDGHSHEGLASDGVPHAKARAFRIPLQVRDHPLVVALSGREPVFFRGGAEDPSPRRAHPLTPLGDDAFHAIPLTRPEVDEEPAPGLLLLAGLEGAPNLDVLWAADLLASRLVCERYRRGRAGQRRFRRERRLLRSIIDAVTDPILLTDSEGRILVANGNAERLFHADEDGSEGLRHAIGLNNMLLSASLFTSSQEGGRDRRELLLVDPLDGRDLLYEVLSTPVADEHGEPGLVSVLRDVNDLRRATQEIEEHVRRLRTAEAEARAKRDRLDMIINSVADPILVTDGEGNILLMNPPAERLFTLPVERVSGSPESRVRANDAVFSSFISNLYTGHSLRWRGELSLVDPMTGAAVPVEAIAGMLVSHKPEDTATVTILHDRSEAIEKARLYEQVKRHSDELRQKVEEATTELVQQNELLRRQAIELEQASQLKSQFLANISHELRTPLNAITGYTGLLLHNIAGELTQKQREKLLRVQSNAHHLLKVIGDLLDITRIEAGQMRVDVETFELIELMDEVMAEMEPIILRSRVLVSHEVAPRVPTLETDRQKIKQIVLNLLSNALKFTPEGFIRVRATYDGANDRVHVAVADTGLGIAAADQEQIFEDFRQVDDSNTRHYGGTGLGLSICRRLSAILGGEVTLVSKPGAGSTFTLEIPPRLTPRPPAKAPEGGDL